MSPAPGKKEDSVFGVLRPCFVQHPSQVLSARFDHVKSWVGISESLRSDRTRCQACVSPRPFKGHSRTLAQPTAEASSVIRGSPGGGAPRPPFSGLLRLLGCERRGHPARPRGRRPRAKRGAAAAGMLPGTTEGALRLLEVERGVRRGQAVTGIGASSSSIQSKLRLRPGLRRRRPPGPARILHRRPPSSVRSDAQLGTPSCLRSPFDLSLARPCTAAGHKSGEAVI